jgi:hypothetical protein
LKEGDHLEDLDVDRRIISKWRFEKWNEGVDWIDLAQDMGTRGTVVNAVINLWVP